MCDGARLTRQAASLRAVVGRRLVRMKLDIALKEWAIVCDLLAAGRCCLLLRKGGIHEAGGPGRFALDHDRFLMFPAWEHERLDWIKKDWLAPDVDHGVDEPEKPEPSRVTFKCWAEAAKIWQVPSRSAFDELDDLHPWARPQIDMRFNYKPDRPLYLLALRCHRLARPAVVTNDDSFAGCVSWVPLDRVGAMEVSASEPAMSDRAFDAVLSRVDAAFA